MPNSTRDYDADCRTAATRQGLDPLTEALAAANVPHTVEQTGGFCMAVVVPAADGGTYAAISDHPEPRPWAVGFYPGDTWTEGLSADDDVTDYPPLDTTTVVDLLRLRPSTISADDLEALGIDAGLRF